MTDLGPRIEALYEEMAPAVSLTEVQSIEVRPRPKPGWLLPTLAAVTLIAVVAFAGVLDLGQEPATTSNLIRVHPAPTGSGMDAIVTGVVEVDLELGCVWLSEASGGRYPVVWPVGTTARTDPFQLTFADGQTAAAGDRVTGGGGYVPAATAVEEPFPEACVQSGDAAVFNADSDIEIEPGVGIDRPSTLHGTFSIPESIGFELISVNPNGRSVAVTEFVEGTIHLFTPDDYVSPTDSISGASGGGGFIHLWAGGTVYSYPGTLTADPVVYQPENLIEEAGIAPTLRVVPAPDGEKVWLVQPGVGRGPTIVELVDLVESEVTRLRSWEVEGSWQPAGATIEGLVLNSTESGRVALIGHEASTLGDIAGTAISVGWQSVAVVDPSDNLVVTDGKLADPTPVNAPGEGTWTGIGGPIIPAEAPPVVTGAEQLLVGLVGGETVSIVIVAPSGESRVVFETTGGGPLAIPNEAGGYVGLPLAAYTRAGDWVCVVEGSAVTLIRVASGEAFDLGTIIPPDHWVLTAG